MYKTIIRPLLFLFSPEAIHHILVRLLKIGRWIPGFNALMRVCFTVRHPSLEREVFGLKFPNPVGLAAGFDKNAEVYRQLGNFGFGFVEIGTVTPEGQPGNPKPRLFRLPADRALINRMGFNNKGSKAAQKNLSRCRCGKRPVIGGNLGKNTATPNDQAPADYLTVFRRLYDQVDYFVVNVSCPNVKDLCGLQNKESLREILSGLQEFRRGQTEYRPILFKISPDLTREQIDETIEVMLEGGVDGIVAINTTTGRDGLQSDPEKVQSLGAGGLSGGPLTARAIETVRYLRKKTGGHFPIIGVGGILTVDDAVALLDAGASLIQIYTGFIYNGPSFVRQICKRLIERA